MDRSEDGDHAAEDLIRANHTGNTEAKLAAFTRMQRFWDSGDIDALAVQVEQKIRAAAG